MKSFIVPALLVTFTTAVPVGLWQLYLYYKKILETQYGTWKHIGTLKEIIIYPLEGSQGETTSNVFCSRDGPAMYSTIQTDNTLLYDRSYIFYSTNSDNAVTLDQKLIKLSSQKVWNAVLKKKFRLTNEERTILYLGNEILVKPLANEVPKNIQRFIENRHGENFRIGLTYNSVRSSLAHDKVVDLNLNGKESNFSNYTLVNLASIEPLRKILKRPDLSYTSFLPHFVIDCPDYENYVEDNIKQLKIGKVFFEKVTPCTHTTFVGANSNPGFNFGGLFEELQRTHALNKLYPELPDSENAPVFGINLEILSDNYTGNVSIDDPIYATFRFDKLSFTDQLKEIIALILVNR